MSAIQNMCLLFPRGAREPTITFLRLINGETENLITLSLGSFFLWMTVNILLDSLCKTNLEHKEIYVSDWLKPPLYKLLTHVLFGFLCTSGLALRYKKPIYSSRVGSIKEH